MGVAAVDKVVVSVAAAGAAAGAEAAAAAPPWDGGVGVAAATGVGGVTHERHSSDVG